MPRNREHATPAARSKAYRERKKGVQPTLTPTPEPTTSDHAGDHAGLLDIEERLRHEMNNARLPSDRITAAKALDQIQKGGAATTDEVALWLAQIQYVDTIVAAGVPIESVLNELLGPLRAPEPEPEVEVQAQAEVA
jgi:hypothetical protein